MTNQARSLSATTSTKLPGQSVDADPAVLRETATQQGLESTGSTKAETPESSDSTDSSATKTDVARATEPLTISLDRELIRRVRVIAACRGTTVSKIITSLLAGAVERELPAVLAELQGLTTSTKSRDR